MRRLSVQIEYFGTFVLAGKITGMSDADASFIYETSYGRGRPLARSL